MMFKPRPKGLGSENFLKLQDGQEVTGVFRGDIHTFKKHWMGEGQNGVECSGDDCQVCKTDPSRYPSFKFRINFVSNADNRWFAKIFEGGGELYDQLASLDKKFDLSKIVVDIQRVGSKKNTKYIVTPRTDLPISKEMNDKILSVALLPLSVEAATEARAG